MSTASKPFCYVWIMVLVNVCANSRIQQENDHEMWFILCRLAQLMLKYSHPSTLVPKQSLEDMYLESSCSWIFCFLFVSLKTSFSVFSCCSWSGFILHCTSCNFFSEGLASMWIRFIQKLYECVFLSPRVWGDGFVIYFTIILKNLPLMIRWPVS